MKNIVWKSEQGKILLLEEYAKLQRSPYEIAEKYKTYANAIRRALIYHKFKLRDQGKAQSAAFKTGRKPHPTEGRERTAEEKVNIGGGIATHWKEHPEYREQVIKRQKENWKNTSLEEKQRKSKNAAKGVRRAATEGSALQRFLRDQLVYNGYDVRFNTHHAISNEDMHVDILLPKERIAIEVDGPSHFLPIYGEETLKKRQEADNIKNGLLVGEGYKVIRIKHMRKHISQTYMIEVSKKLLQALSTKSKITIVSDEDI